ERVVEQLIQIFPHADVFALVDFLPDNRRSYLNGKRPKTTFIQKLPFANGSFRSYFPLFPMAVESHDLRGYDLILSSSHLSAKGVIINQDQLHICYCHSPCRFAWDLYHQYLEESGLIKGIKGFLAQAFLSRLRIWDQISNQRVHHFIANSGYISSRIQHVYGRSSEVVYPPVDTEAFDLQEVKGDYYFAASRLVPYKKMDLIVEAFSKMPDKKLILTGSGTEAAKIQKLIRPNIEYRKEADFQTFQKLMAGAKAFVFAAEEDFGITMAEALSCGTPVLAFGKGGATEIVESGKSGFLFKTQSMQSIIDCVNLFEKMGVEFSPSEIRQTALRFSIRNFRKNIIQVVSEKWASFQK
ncbi:MAG TPA: glycosyltransferase, partial [Catalimonadaceae bacterium]|nr:glycosyltransferase [Catalimonadaceae bacterium]